MGFFQRLFQTSPSSPFNYYLEMAIVIAITIILSIVFSKIYSTRKKNDPAFKKIFRHTSSRLSLFAIAMTILLLIRSENIPYFSMRLWLYLTVLGFVIFVGKTIYNYYKKYPAEKLKYHKKPKKEQKRVYSTSKKRK